MVISREFVTWDRPILHSAADWLIRSATVSPENLPLVDLSHCLVVVPGGLAGRRLVELLVQKVEHDGRSLIPPVVITVGQLPEHLYEAKLPFASELTQQFAWGETLRAFGNDQLKPLIPFPPDANDLGTWRDYGDSVRRVYRELVSDAFDFSEVAQKAHSLEDFTEQPRWDVLAKLQSAYLARLDTLQMWDKQSARLYAIKQDECHSDSHIVLLATVDLNRATRQMLDQVAGKGGKVTAIVGAPDSWSDHFDEHGCLVADAWTDEAIELDWKSVAIVDGPTQQADEAVGAIASVAKKYTAKDIIVGLPDEHLLGEVRRIFGQHGLKCRFGPGRSVVSTLPFRLIETIIELSQTRQYNALAAALRHPDLFQTLTFAQPGIEKLDNWFNKRLPDVIDNSIQNEEVSQAVGKLNELAAPFVGEKRSLPEWADQVRMLLLAVYGSQTIDLDTEANFQLARPLQAVNEAMTQWNDIPETLSQAFGASEMLRVLKSQLSSSMIPAEHDAEAIEALGWLELPLMDAPVCVVTSFNDGLIPSANTADLFLPNSLRNLLGLEDDSIRYARDAYQVQAIQHSREVVKWIVPKRSADGDPLAPSRLLFTGSTNDLANRVHKFFGTPEDPQNQAKQPGQDAQDHQQRIAIPVPDSLEVVEMPAWDRFSATRINQYLKCPYRFYLKYVLRLRGEDDSSTELDGGAFGNLAHDTLQAFGTSDLKGSADEKVIFDFLSAELSDLAAKRYGKSPLATIKLQIEQLRLRLRAFAAGQAQHRQDGWIIHRCEAEVAGPYPTILVDGNEIELEGRIDRIDHHPESGQWAVWDYKTGDSTGDPEKDHQIGPRNDKKWVSVQLPFYRHLVKSVGVRGEVSLGYITLPKLGEEVRFREAKWGESDLDEADATIVQAIQDIRAGKFFPPGDVRYEDEFSRICQDTVLGKWEPAQ
ncbi:ATP-dependent helicase/deoxyribonuclease subunit B [Planctomycetes bacterium FF15]|uniref:ATP-dependent helicase/deoxyribonuclease subunit B n=2 Tax=Bremerella alba TaxID=980252 RepID=A0A7V8V6I1_9BACT|nr:ATP-dependent helicase/deoxyribonuclease subunit B [Bremerella alba]